MELFDDRSSPHPPIPGWDDSRIAHVSTVIGALDSPLRIRILLLLQRQPYVVHELVSYLGKSQPLVSQHLRVLKNAGLVKATRTGREVAYSLATAEAIAILESAATLNEAPATDAGFIGSVAALAPQSEIKPDADPGLIPETPAPPQ